MNEKVRADQLFEETLIHRAVNGDINAFNRLVLSYQNLAVRHAYSLLGDWQSAEDCAQESFIKVFQNLSSFRRGSFRSWLLKIVTNTSFDILRYTRRRPVQPLVPEDRNGGEIESPAWLTDTAASVQAIVEQKEQSRQLNQMLEELPEIFRSVLTQVDMNGLDQFQVAAASGIPVGTVKSRLARARLRMKDKLAVAALSPADRYQAGARVYA